VIAATTSMTTFTETSSGVQSFDMIGGNVLTLAQDDDFIGSLVTANEPIAMWLSSHTEIPFNWPEANITYLQVAPTSDWAAEYAAVPFPSRYPPHDLGSIWRVVGDVDGTVLTYDPATPSGAPTTIDAGGLAIFRTTTPFVVRAQDSAHSFHVSQVMSSCSDSTGDYDAGNLYGPDGGVTVSCDGNTAIQHTPPLWEYGSHYVFFTDAAYPTTKLVFIRHKTSTGMHDVTLDCAGTLAGWMPIDAEGEYEYTYVALSDGNFMPQVYSGGTCDNGSRVADSDGPFSIAVWQWGTLPADMPGASYEDISLGYTVAARTINPRTTNGDAGSK
jgi:hypothetical protein